MSRPSGDSSGRLFQAGFNLPLGSILTSSALLLAATFINLSHSLGPTFPLALLELALVSLVIGLLGFLAMLISTPTSKGVK